MRDEPLFIRFANGHVEAKDIIASVLESVDHVPTKEIAEKKKNEVVDLSLFRRDFRNLLVDLTDNGITQKLKNYVDSYMKPSLIELVDGGGSRSGETRRVSIKAEDTPWLEAVVCYNLCVYIRAFGFKEIKQCPVCSKFFSNKGKYAKYCSESCKAQKGV